MTYVRLELSAYPCTKVWFRYLVVRLGILETNRHDVECPDIRPCTGCVFSYRTSPYAEK